MAAGTVARPRPGVLLRGWREAHPRGFTLAVGAGIVVLLLVVATVAVCFGSVNVGVGRVLTVLWYDLRGDGARVDPLDQLIVWNLRLPRVLLAGTVGVALALAGAALQGLVRNPLADPYVIGVSSGGALGAVLVMAYGASVLGGMSVTGAAFGGAMLMLVAVFAFAQRGGAFTDSRLVLAGVALGYVAMAATSFAQLEARPGEIRGILFWTMGSVSGARWSTLAVPVVVTAACGGWLLTRARGLNALALGDDDAVAVGVNLRGFRLGLLVVAALLTAVAVSSAGGVGFVGLVVPQAVRMLVGGDHRRLLPLSALAGALLLVGVDVVARTVLSPDELPLTIFTALLGGPFFLLLMRRQAAPS